MCYKFSNTILVIKYRKQEIIRMDSTRSSGNIAFSEPPATKQMKKNDQTA